MVLGVVIEGETAHLEVVIVVIGGGEVMKEQGAEWLWLLEVVGIGAG
jgi:hypothetical protein